MPHFEWKVEYEIKDQQIDEQHKQLIELANLLYSAVENREEDAILKKAFEGLFHYTKHHFQDEEQYFQQLNCTILEDHRAEHRQLEDEISALWQDDMLGFREDTLKDLEAWVENRLIPHMTINDQEALKASK